MSISVKWNDTEPPEIDIDLFIRVGPTGARSLRAWLRGQDMNVDANIITDYLASISAWRAKRKDVK